MTTDLVPVERVDVVPGFAITPEDAGARMAALREFVHSQMHKDSDFGVIPGTDKPTLLKPGAEKLCNIFGFAIEQEVTSRVERWDDPGFFHYEVTVSLRNKRTGIIEAEGVGSCNSKESKYRWRRADRLCPQCNQPAIIKGREQYGGGWLCFAKKGGCGAKWPAGAREIEGQQIGRVENPDIYDQVNTILKMAAKRALVDATLKAVRASDLFTQDLEDLRGGDSEDSDPPPPRDVASTAAGTLVDTTTGEVLDAPAGPHPPQARAQHAGPPQAASGAADGADPAVCPHGVTQADVGKSWAEARETRTASKRCACCTSATPTTGRHNCARCGGGEQT